MKIEHRDKSGASTNSIGVFRVRVVLDWLLEFRFSTIEILAYRIGAKSVNDTYRFFKKLCDEGLIQSFANVHTRSDRFYMLAAGGIHYLQAEGRDTLHGITRVSHLARYSKILHDIAVQSAIVKRLGAYSEVIWDKNIDMGDDRPDALLHSKKGWWAALEFERFRKDKRRIYMSFAAHGQAMVDERYSGVYYLFAEKADMEYYQAVFAEKTWQRYERQPKSGILKELDSVFVPDDHPKLRERYIFTHEPINVSLIPRMRHKMEHE